MLANILIGLREGLEAALVVGILIAYLHKLGQREKTRFVWLGVWTAVAFSIATAAFFTLTSFQLSEENQEILAGILSIGAAALITWMILWLAKKSRFLKSELESGVDRAVATGSASLFTLAFLAVGREGLETAIFMWNAIMNSDETATPVFGTLVGILISIGLGWALYLGSLKINLAKFFRISGAALVIVAAGMFSYGVHELQEGGVLPGGDTYAYDISSTLDPKGFVATILKGSISFSVKPSILQVIAWFVFCIPVAIAFYKQSRQRAK